MSRRNLFSLLTLNEERDPRSLLKLQRCRSGKFEGTFKIYCEISKTIFNLNKLPFRLVVIISQESTFRLNFFGDFGLLCDFFREIWNFPVNCLLNFQFLKIKEIIILKGSIEVLFTLSVILNGWR